MFRRHLCWKVSSLWVRLLVTFQHSGTIEENTEYIALVYSELCFSANLPVPPERFKHSKSLIGFDYRSLSILFGVSLRCHVTSKVHKRVGFLYWLVVYVDGILDGVVRPHQFCLLDIDCKADCPTTISHIFVSGGKEVYVIGIVHTVCKHTKLYTGILVPVRRNRRRIRIVG